MYAVVLFGRLAGGAAQSLKKRIKVLNSKEINQFSSI